MIGTRHIAVWVMATEGLSADEVERFHTHLSPDELDRVRRFLRASDRRQYAAAHALMRLMLGSALGDERKPRSLQFRTGPQGKPALAGRAGPHFNLSHCDGLVACAVCREAEIGVDVELLRPEAPLEVAEDYFAQAERDWLRSLPAATQAEGFFRFWTLKEAYIKATGLGLSQSFHDFAFGFDPIRVHFADPLLGDAAAWRFHQERLETGHLLALAWRAAGAELPVRVRAVTPQDLALLHVEADWERTDEGAVDWCRP